MNLTVEYQYENGCTVLRPDDGHQPYVAQGIVTDPTELESLKEAAIMEYAAYDAEQAEKAAKVEALKATAEKVAGIVIAEADTSAEIETKQVERTAELEAEAVEKVVVEPIIEAPIEPQP